MVSTFELSVQFRVEGIPLVLSSREKGGRIMGTTTRDYPQP